MKRVYFLVLGALLACIFSSPAWAGTLTTNEFIYKPALGARGAAEKNAFDTGMDRVDARLAKEIWVGDPKYGSTLQSALTAIGSNPVMLRVPPGTHNISSDLTVPANVNLRVERGATLAIATTKTLTINGPLEAGPYQIFSCPDWGQVAFGTASVPHVLPQWWGARGNGVNDDATAINAALAAYTNVFLSPGTYKIGSTLEIGKVGQTLQGAGWGSVIDTSTCNGIAIDISAGAHQTRIANLAISGSVTGGNDQWAAIHSTGAPEDGIYDVTLENLYIVNSRGCGIVPQGMTGVNISNVVIEASYSHNLYLSLTKQARLSNLRLINGAARDPSGGNDLKIKNSSDVLVQNCYLSGGSLSNVVIERDIAATQRIHLVNLNCNATVAGSSALKIYGAGGSVSDITVTGGSYLSAAGAGSAIVLNGAGGGNIPSYVNFCNLRVKSVSDTAVYATYGEKIFFTGGTYECYSAAFAITTTSNTGSWYFSGVNLVGGYGINHEGTAMYVTGCAHLATGTPADFSFVPGSSTLAVIINSMNNDGLMNHTNRAKNCTSSQNPQAKDSGRAFTNFGASTGITMYLPPATPGLELTFYRVTSQNVRIRPDGSETIRGGGAGKYMDLDTDGDSVKLKCLVAGYWEIVEGYGTYYYEP
jgi:hypothetical protein